MNVYKRHGIKKYLENYFGQDGQDFVISKSFDVSLKRKYTPVSVTQ